MTQITDLHPSEEQIALALQDLMQIHMPRTAAIGHTGMHGCVVCDEVWPCSVASMLAAFRDVAAQCIKMADAIIVLTDVAEAAGDVITALDTADLTSAQQLAILGKLEERLIHVKQSREKQP